MAGSAAHRRKNQIRNSAGESRIEKQLVGRNKGKKPIHLTLRFFACRCPSAGGRAAVEHRQKSRLRNIHIAEPFHSFFAGFLLFQQFLFAGDIAAVAFGEDIFFAVRAPFRGRQFFRRRRPCTATSNIWRGINSRMRPAVSRPLRSASARGTIIARASTFFAVDQHFQFNDVGGAPSLKIIIQRRPSAAGRFHPRKKSGK